MSETVANPRRGIAIAAALLVPGTGHLTRGRFVRGGLWIVGMWLSIHLTVLSPAWIALPCLLFVVQAVDAAIVKVDRDRLPAVPWVAVSWVVALFAMWLLGAATKRYFMQSYKISSASMVPTLQIGDHMLIFKRAAVERGDVVVLESPCSPGKQLTKRVVAMAGDTVEIRCSRLYVNGEAVPRELQGDCMYSDYDEHTGAMARTCSRYRESLGERSYDIVLPPGFEESERAGPGIGRHAYRLTQMDFPADRPIGCPPESPSDPGRVIEEPAGPGEGPCAQQRRYLIPDGHLFLLGDNRYNSADSVMWGAVPQTRVRGRVVSLWFSWPPGENIKWSRCGRKVR